MRVKNGRDNRGQVVLLLNSRRAVMEELCDLHRPLIEYLQQHRPEDDCMSVRPTTARATDSSSPDAYRRHRIRIRLRILLRGAVMAFEDVFLAAGDIKKKGTAPTVSVTEDAPDDS